ncbi:MAG TPA: SRPBCC family protein [Flavobacteriaceae bacterium]|nr:SRPBCC family protein [Flavobacteriaceae bacterium]
MKLESSKTSVQKSRQQVFDFLNEVKNYEQLMPDSIEKFEILSPEAFLFQLKGMPEIQLEKKEIHEPEQIVLGARSEKLPFTLTAEIKSISEETSELQFLFEGKFNAMMAMMIKSPIQKFIDTLSENIQKQL